MIYFKDIQRVLKTANKRSMKLVLELCFDITTNLNKKESYTKIMENLEYLYQDEDTNYIDNMNIRIYDLLKD